jgi:hypothetical protein
VYALNDAVVTNELLSTALIGNPFTVNDPVILTDDVDICIGKLFPKPS